MDAKGSVVQRVAKCMRMIFLFQIIVILGHFGDL